MALSRLHILAITFICKFCWRAFLLVSPRQAFSEIERKRGELLLFSQNDSIYVLKNH